VLFRSTRGTKRNDTLEDVFEAFFGATEHLIDERIKRGMGCPVVYSIIDKICENTEMLVDYENTMDPISQLKEYLEKPGNKNRNSIYVTKREDSKFYTKVMIQDNSGKRMVDSIYNTHFSDKDSTYKGIITTCLN